MSAPLAGIIPPILTPLRGGRPDLAALRTLLDRADAAGCPAVFVGGTAGLGPLLADADWEAVAGCALAWGRRPVLVGVMETSTPRAIARLRRLERLGGSAYVLTPAFYVTLRRGSEFLRHFDACRAASPLEQVIYNIPGCTGSAIPPAVLEDCVRRGICRSIKDSSGDRAAVAALCARVNALGGSVLQGNRPDLAWLRRVGAAGLVPVPANLDPVRFTAAWRAVAEGGDLAPHQAGLDRLWDALVAGDDWISGSTWALGRQGLGDGQPIAPLEPCPLERRAGIEALLGGGP